MAKLSQRVTLPITTKELRALRWNARQLKLQRSPGREPSAAGVLRLMSLEEAVRRYDDSLLQRLTVMP